MSASEEEGPPSYVSIDETDADVLAFENSNLQRNLTQIPQQLARNLIAGRQTIANPVPTFQPCLAMSDDKAMSTPASELFDVLASGHFDVPASGQFDVPASGQFDVPDSVREMLKDDLHDRQMLVSDNETSEYYSEENRSCLPSGADGNDLTHINEMGEEREYDPPELRKGGEPVSSRMSRSSTDEDLQSKRASLVESKNRYCSIEYDPSRRESIPVISPRPNLPRDDSVFSDDQPPISKRKVSRERLVKQWSQSAPDLPDLLQSLNAPDDPSPDIVQSLEPMLYPGKRQRAQSEEILNTGAGNNGSLGSNHKVEIEGKVYNGKSLQHSIKRSVSFHESATVYDIPQEKSQNQNLFSPQGEEARQFFRHRSSGYGTGSSSKGSLQSQLSDQTNFSDSVITDNSVDQEEFPTLEENNHTLTSAGQADMLPCLSIFQSDSTVVTTSLNRVNNPSLYVDGFGDSIKNSCEDENKGNVPNFDLLEKSTGSFQLPSDLTQEGIASGTVPEDLTPGAVGGYSEENSPVDVGNHLNYDLKVLDDCMKRDDPQICPYYCLPNNAAALASGSLGIYRNEPSHELLQKYLMTLDDTPADVDTILSHVNKMLVPSDSSTPSPSLQIKWVANLSSPDLSKSFFYPVLSNIEEQEEVIDHQVSKNDKSPVDWRFRDKLMERLERASRCQEDMCEDRDCAKAKKILTMFENNIQVQASLDKEQETILLALRCHGERCDNIKCPMPYCALLIDVEPWDPMEAISRIRQQLDIILEMTDTSTEPGRFLRLSPNCQYTGPVREGEDWMVLSPLSKSHNVVLISDIFPTSRAPSVLKKMPLLELDHQWHVYEKMRSLSHPNLVEHLWVMEQGRDLLICTQFMGAGSLRQVLRETKKKLAWKTTVNYMQQIIRGVLALHDRQIAYINWTACNILLDETRQVAKVSNLSVSANLESHAVDYGGMKHALPAAILPPELLGPVPSVCTLSDSWGCGCLLHELTMGHKIWYRYRHETRDAVWKKLQGKVPPIAKDLVRWPDIFQACWQPGLLKRHPLKHIQQMLTMTLTATTETRQDR
ncbi:uncharacterized protein LOC124138244 [Haliotis rufescens]|uniref:uncharacterized protein LOC124138244 n=1 Tax=Haliotis rufescens TaxID=6454 RepID=UPI00201F273C|nr:uncharacterized protein LOC124138244 [Haliotis rufescens]